MIRLQDIRSVYFIGIGGIGMSALARYFHERGVLVSGYDRTPSPLTRLLESEGMSVHYEEEIRQANQHPDLVIYTPAIPSDHKELVFYKDHHFPVIKRSDALSLIVKDMFCITVGGTHGKTTTSSLIAHILRQSGYGCNAFLGGISANYNTNFWSNERQVAVVEADEYDRSFLKLEPDIAVLTAMDPDHLDIYGTEQAMQDAYILYTQQIKAKGLLVYKSGLPRSNEMGGYQKITYSLQDKTADSYAQNIIHREGGYTFDIRVSDKILENAELDTGGLHNVENAVAAVTVSTYLNIDASKIKAALASFKGVRRRFEYIIKSDRHIYIDDYAHHPEELKTLIKSSKTLFPDKKCTIIFQPHLYSRTRDLATSFAQVLDMADQAILLPIYPAREKPIPGVDSGLLAGKMKNKNVKTISKEEALTWLKAHKPQLLITAGAGDIDRMVPEIKGLLES
jgi:UDP-N-acetylmuramate--alanine ligase